MNTPGAPKKSRRSREDLQITYQDLEEENMVEPVNVFCIEPSDPGITKEENAYYQETFTLMNDCGVGAVWLSEEKALEVASNSDSFYFMAAFRGPVFEHLKKLGVNLYGVHVVRQTLNSSGSLPRWDFPVYSLNMTGACVCFTGLSLARREELKDKINYMNGVVSPCLTERVTHLVTERCDTSSKKYTEARRMNLAVMLPLWVEKAWEAAQSFSNDLFTSKEMEQRYRTPVFSKMVITATGVGGSERMDIARLIELHGGRFSGDMKRNECTHLIADQTKGVKYKKAREWNSIKIVRSTWLRKSVMAGYVLPESAFDPEKRNRCSTPVQESRIMEPEELDCSLIQGKGGRLDNSTFNTQITKPEADAEEAEHVSLSAVRSNLRREPSRHRLATSTPSANDPIDELDETCLRGDFDFLETRSLRGKKSVRSLSMLAERMASILEDFEARQLGVDEDEQLEVVEEQEEDWDPQDELIDVERQASGGHMITFSGGTLVSEERGCRIWVCGSDQSRADKWKKVLDRSGATRVAGLEAASHIIVVHASAADRSKLLQARSRGAHVVRGEWISACYKRKDQVPLEEFLWDPEDTVCRTTSVASVQAFEDTPRRSQASSRPSGSTATNKDLIASDFLNLAPLRSLSNDSDVASVFRALTFRVRGLLGDTGAQIVKELRSAGGKVVPTSDDSRRVNYLICSHIDFGQVWPQDSYDEAVTTFWVKRCLMECRLLKPSSHPLFRPLPAVKESKVFSNVVVVISCFSDYERLALADLVREFGGEVQETLTKRNHSGQQAVTHVIGGCEGDRVAEARRQKFKVVDPSWVIESIINDKLMKEDLFPLKEEAYASYEGRTDDLWPEALKTAENVRIRDKSRSAEGLRNDFSDLIMDELQSNGTPDLALPRRTKAATPSIGGIEQARTSTLLSSVPTRLRSGKLADKTLDMKKPFKPNYRGLTQVVENIPSPGSASADTSNESLTTSMVGRILKEVVLKTAVTKPHELDPTSADNVAVPRSLKGKGTTPVSRQGSRKATAKQASVAVPSVDVTSKDDGMMVLRARMTERLEKRNREIAHQLAEKGSSKGSQVERPTQQESGSLRGQKRQQSSDEVEPSPKRALQTAEATSQGHERSVPQPLIDWQPAMTSRLSSNSLLSGNEPLDATRPSEPQEKIRGSVAAQRQHLTAKSKDTPSRDLAKVPLEPAAVRKELQQVDQEKVQRAPAGGAPKTHPAVFPSLPQRLERVPGGGVDQTGARSAPEQLVLDQVSTTTAGRTGSGDPGPAPSSVQISVKKERVSVVLSDTVRRFVFTSVLPQERLRLSNIISRLGGIADPGELNDDVTHLICGKLIRGAKLMGCIASGRWVLGSDYVDKSLEAGKWLPEADFELGNPSKLASKSFSEREQKLAEACRRWRLKLGGRGASKRSGAFHRWRCVLYCSEEKAAGLVPMLQAGGVDAVTMRQGSEGAPHTFRPTHAVVCSSAMWNGEELEMLVDVGAKVFQLEYISKFLLEENVDEAAYYHVEYKKFLQCRR